MIRRTIGSASVALLCGVFGLAGCGSSSDSGTTSQSNGGSGTASGGSSAPSGGSSSSAGTNSGGHSSVGGSSGAAALGGSGPTAGGGSGGAQTAGGSAGISGGSAGGSAGAGGAGTKQTACNFASGLNVAWVKFANDVPNPDIATFDTIFKNTHDAGGRVVRWWFHTNGTVTPGYGTDGKALPITQAHIDGVKAILASAHKAGIGLVISLWSFDMLQDNAGAAHTNNQALLENDDNRQAYIDRYLTPLVTALKGTPGLYSYEIFNEPEGMLPNPKGWSTYRTTEASIQKTVNWCAAAIHAADPTVLVTSSAVTFDYCSNVSGKTNYYSDAQLRQVGGKQNGTLDYYEVHYYTANGSSNSAFTRSASDWGLDKKLVMGEFAAADTDGVVKNDLGKYLYEHGYNGGWAWSYDADWPWPAEQGPLQTLYAAHADVGNCPVTP